MPFSPPGSGLLIELVNVVVELLGVPWAEAFGEWVLPTRVVLELAAEGDAVPEEPSFLPFDLLFSRLARDNWSCYVSQKA